MWAIKTKLVNSSVPVGRDTLNDPGMGGPVVEMEIETIVERHFTETLYEERGSKENGGKIRKNMLLICGFTILTAGASDMDAILRLSLPTTLQVALVI